MSIHPKIERLIQLLDDRTEAGKVRWQPTDKPTSFLSVLSSGSVLVETKDQDGTSPYALRIINDDGVVTETFYTRHFEAANRSASTERPEPWELALRDLHQRARSAALGIDKTISALLDELGTEDDIPF